MYIYTCECRVPGRVHMCLYICIEIYTNTYVHIYICPRHSIRWFVADSHIPQWVCDTPMTIELCVIYPSIHEQAPRCMHTETDLHNALLFIEYIRVYIQTHTYTDTEREQNSKWESWLEWRGGERTILQQKHRQPYPCPKTGMCAWVCGLKGARVFEGVRLYVCFTMCICVCVCVCISQKCPGNVIRGGYDE